MLRLWVGGALLLLLYGLFVGKHLYSALLAAAIVALLTAERLPSPYPSRIAFVLCSISAAAYFSELTLAIGMPLRAGIFAWLDGRYYDFRTYHAVVRDFRGQGRQAYPCVFARGLAADPAYSGEILPLGAISNATTVYCNESGEYLIYESDEHGFHNPPGAWNQDVEIAVVGDSFAQGACVPSEQSFVGRIREQRPSVLNLGMGGNGPLLELAGIEEYLADLRPRIVLWCFFEGNDLDDVADEAAHPILSQYLTEEGFRQDLGPKQRAIDDALIAHVNKSFALDRDTPAYLDSVVHRLDLRATLPRIARLSHLRGVANRAFDDPLGYSVRDQSTQTELLGQVLRRAVGRVRSWEGKLVFVVLPSWDLAVQGSERRRIAARLAAETAQSAGATVLDLTQVFEETQDPAASFYFPGSHYSEAGHELVGRQLLKRLDRLLE